MTMGSGEDPDSRHERQHLELLCLRNLLANREERIYFTDRESRFLMVSDGWLATVGGGRSRDDVIGRTDFDVFAVEHAAETELDELRIMATGQPVVAKTEYEGRPDGTGTRR